VLAKENLHPYFVTGFSDGESSFTISIRRNNELRTGWLVVNIFVINLHKKDRALLEQIKSFFGVGKVINHEKDVVTYRLSSIKDLEILIFW